MDARRRFKQEKQVLPSAHGAMIKKQNPAASAAGF
jgi:hypothetical protein